MATPIYIYIQLFIALITDFTLCSSMALLVSYLSGALVLIEGWLCWCGTRRVSSCARVNSFKHLWSSWHSGAAAWPWSHAGWATMPVSILIDTSGGVTPCSTPHSTISPSHKSYNFINKLSHYPTCRSHLKRRWDLDVHFDVHFPLIQIHFS